MSRTSYKNKYRKTHPKLRNKTRKSNYSKTRPKVKVRREWHIYEIEMLSFDVLTDREIAGIINRSVQAIQQKRYKLKGGK